MSSPLKHRSPAPSEHGNRADIDLAPYLDKQARTARQLRGIAKNRGKPLYWRVAGLADLTMTMTAEELGAFLCLIVTAHKYGGILPGDSRELKVALDLVVQCFTRTYNRLSPPLLGRFFYRDEHGDFRPIPELEAHVVRGLTLKGERRGA